MTEPSASTSGMDCGIDAAVALARLDGDTELFMSLLESFLEAEKETVQAVSLLLTQGCQDQALAALHRLRGVAANIGADGVARLASSAETAIRQHGGHGLSEILPRIQAAMTQVQETADRLALSGFQACVPAAASAPGRDTAVPAMPCACQWDTPLQATVSPPTPASKGRILAVDDCNENLRVLGHVLQDEYQMQFAMGGLEALALVENDPPDLILLDVMMPDLDGYSVCAQLKASERTREIPILFVTSLVGAVEETRALDAGAVDFISKPVNASIVRARVRTHLTIKRQSDLLRQMAMTDGLTGIANRRCFDAALDREWRRCNRVEQPLAIIMADVDHFKAYNDLYGHKAGDDCLAAVAGALSQSVRRPPDLVARYGGEEFVVLLPHEDMDGAEIVAQRILDHVRALAIPHGRSSCAGHVTISLGLAASRPDRSYPPVDLLVSADERLYRAKNWGRDRYCAC